MATEISVRRAAIGGQWCLLPISKGDEQKIEDLKNDEIVGTFRKPRNMAHHNKFWAMMRGVAKHTDYTAEQLEKIVANCMGHCEFVTDKKGRTWAITKSIACEKMEQLEFEKFYQRTIDVLIQDILPDWTQGDVEKAAVDEVISYA